MIVTLLTDFGTEDYFVGAMKGVILGRDPGITIVDITHRVPRHDVRTGAFLMSAVYRDFPPGSVHVAVVDPGVGSDRRPIAIRAAGLFFVGPDNGVFEHVLAHERHEARAITNPALHRQSVSSTFHGRDIFAPTAAALATGFSFADIGPLVDPVRTDTPDIVPIADGFEGRILHIDHFGNCVTSFRPAELPGGVARYDLVGDGWRVTETRTHYDGASAGNPFMIPGSAGYLEISIDRASAAEALGISRSARVRAVRKTGDSLEG